MALLQQPLHWPPPALPVAVPLSGASAAGPLLLLGHAAVLLFMLAVAFYYGAAPPDPGTLLTPFSGALLGLFAWMLVSWSLASGTLFNPYGLFLMAAMPFHGGYAVLHLLHQEQQMTLLGDFTPATLYLTLALVLFGFAFLHLGALLCEVFWPHPASHHPDAPAETETRTVYLVGWLLVAVALVPVVQEARASLAVVMSIGYKGLFQGATIDGDASNTLSGLLSSFFLPGVFYLLAGSRERWIGRAVSLVLVLGYASAYLFMGYRAYALLPLVAYAWLWHRCIRPLPLVPFSLAGLGLFLFVAPLVRHVRNLEGSARLSPSVVWEAYTSVENPVLALLGEMGGTVLTIGYTLDLVPSVRPFEGGMGYLRAWLNAVPVVDMPNVYGDWSTWLAWQVKPLWAANGFGFGYSFIAEAYANFGGLGAPLALAVVGGLMVGFLRWAGQSPDPARYALVAAFMPALLFYVRGEMISLSRPLLWYALTPWLAVLLLREAQRRMGKGKREGKSG
jgi:oligosaccharide repeat unit polymerase